MDCIKCVYGAEDHVAENTVCCYYGSEETDSDGECSVFELKIEMGNLPWNERVPIFTLEPESASLHDIIQLATELMEARHMLAALQNEEIELVPPDED